MYTITCKIADFTIKFETTVKTYKNSMCDYLYDFNLADFYVSISENDVTLEKEIYDHKTPPKHPFVFQRSALFRTLAEQLPKRDAFVLHSAVFDIQGSGIALAAHSGTGKTTHMNRWQSYLGDKMTIVNGDKPIVRFFDDEPNQPYAYGTPWMGKENFGCNMRTPLKHICFIERSDDNFVESIDKNSAVKRIMNQIYMPRDPAAVMETIQLADRLLSCCNLWVIHCNMDDDAGEIAYKAIFEN